MANRYLPMALAPTAIMLSGCLFDPPSTYFPPPEDPEVASRCTPVRALLSKNFYKGASADLAVVSAGAVTDIRGAVLSADEAARISKLDYFCRAWVKGAISDADYGRALFAAVSMSIVETVKERDRDALAEAVAGLMQQLQAKGIVPGSVSPADLPAQVKSDSRYTKAELEQRFAELTAQTQFDFEAGRQRDAKLQAEVMIRLGVLEKGPPVAPEPQSGTPNAAVAVYFSTGSAELTHDAKRRLKEQAAQWTKRGAGVRVVGHADPRGSAVLNRALSLRRAEAVAAELARLAVAVVLVEGAGATSATDPEAYDAYRMVRIEPDQGPVAPRAFERVP